MPVARIPLLDWTPDKGELNNSGLSQVYGAVPTPSGWACPPIVAVKGQTDAKLITLGVSAAYGFHIHSVCDTNLYTPQLYYYIGTGGDLFRSTTNDSLLMVPAKPIPGGFSPTPASGWQFASYGNSIVATDFSSHIQYAATPTTDFADMITYTTPDSYRPKARFVSSIKQHLLLGHIKFATAPSATITTSALSLTSYPDMVMWSATDNIRRFGDPGGCASTSVVGSDFQLLSDDYGAITGVSGGDFAYIFKERAIYLMEGPPFQFRRIVSGIGTIYPNSIVRYHDDVYFWGPGGPYRLRDGSNTPERIGDGIVQRTVLNANGPTYDFPAPGTGSGAGGPQYFMEDELVNLSHVGSFCDYTSGNVVFTATCDSAGLYNTKLLVYNIGSGRFGFWSTGGKYNILYPKTIASYKYAPATVDYVHQQHSSEAISSVDQGIDFNGTYFLGGQGDTVDLLVPGKFVSQAYSTVAGTFNYDNIQHLTLSTPFLTFPLSEGPEAEAYKASSITRIKPIYTGDKAAVVVNVKSTSRFPEGDDEYYERDAEYYPSQSYQDDNGWITINTLEATHHKITVTIRPNLAPGGTHTSVICNPIAYCDNLVTLEIEYMLGGKSGSAWYNA